MPVHATRFDTTFLTNTAVDMLNRIINRLNIYSQFQLQSPIRLPKKQVFFVSFAKFYRNILALVF